MKIIPLHEAAANLAKYGKLCHRDPILVTVKGEPAFKLMPYKPNEDPFVDELLKENSAFHAKAPDKKKKGVKMETKGVLEGLRSRERMDKRNQRPAH